MFARRFKDLSDSLAQVPVLRPVLFLVFPPAINNHFTTGAPFQLDLPAQRLAYVTNIGVVKQVV